MKYTLITLILTAIAFVPPIKSAEMKSPTNSKTSFPSVAEKQNQELEQARTSVEKLTATQQKELLEFINQSSDKQLITVKGIAKGRSKSIVEARPFKTLEQLVEVKGIGLSTFGRILEHAKTMKPSQ